MKNRKQSPFLTSHPQASFDSFSQPFQFRTTVPYDCSFQEDVYHRPHSIAQRSINNGSTVSRDFDWSKGELLGTSANKSRNAPIMQTLQSTIEAARTMGSMQQRVKSASMHEQAIRRQQLHQHVSSIQYQTINPYSQQEQRPYQTQSSLQSSKQQQQLSRYKILEEYDRTLLLIKTLCRASTPHNAQSQSILSLIVELEEKLQLRKREYELQDLVVFESLKRKKKHYKAMAKRMKGELAKACEREKIFLNRIHQLETERPFMKKEKDLNQNVQQKTNNSKRRDSLQIEESEKNPNFKALLEEAEDYLNRKDNTSTLATQTVTSLEPRRTKPTYKPIYSKNEEVKVDLQPSITLSPQKPPKSSLRKLKPKETYNVGTAMTQFLNSPLPSPYLDQPEPSNNQSCLHHPVSRQTQTISSSTKKKNNFLIGCDGQATKLNTDGGINRNEDEMANSPGFSSQEELNIKLMQAEQRIANGTLIDPMLLNISSMFLAGDETVLIDEPSVVKSPANLREVKSSQPISTALSVKASVMKSKLKQPTNLRELLQI
ncbi:hypothetical protein FGO68_gene11247 [Halteria grandinella]|uniref:Uncharacterized protein n=1 Tax=Halteria grandinella TaxID=5974 RepID=A0A8J8NTS6_HALGN|nr:hypothetical protein FGO68_gene11247 [Halteria grandinella]